MSSFNNSNRRTPFTTARKPHCNHCQNTGEPESVYTSHYPSSLPDRNGKRTTTCPKLLKTECSYCYNFGHLRSICPARLQQQSNAARAHPQKQERKPEKKVTFDNRGGGFSCLKEDQVQEQVPQKKEEFPALPSATDKPATAKPSATDKPAISGYASAAARPPAIYRETQPVSTSNFQILRKGDRMKKTDVPKKIYPKGSWAADSSSEESDDEDEAAITFAQETYKKSGRKNDPWMEDHMEFAGKTVSYGGGYGDAL